MRYAAWLLALVSLPVLGQATEEAQPLVWSCQAVPGPRPAIYCIDSAQTRDVQPAVVRVDPPPASYAADLFAAGHGANITRLTRTKPDLYAGRSWAVPLFSPAIDDAMTRQLAFAVMCGREPSCNVELARTPGLPEFTEKVSLPIKRSGR